MKPTETFQALLCDPLGNFVVGGCMEDKRLLNEAFQEMKDIEKYGRHIHKATVNRDDICALCGHNLRHSIHLRYGE